ncbi:hypothetical protein [Paraflavitalea speifideaquila]|uniref:hypothetical protein n=1 Tax=Paraflavitalea speifideaquila TaxID=3076558 RepID=UPI0028EABDD1|nr:hypothetical protein [Paraflavitalea speifideiaquila]
MTDSAQLRHNLVYEQFMNHRLGYVKTAEEYLLFNGQCYGTIVSANCDSLQDMVAGFNMARQQTHGVETRLGYGGPAQLTNPYTIMTDGMLRLPDSVRAKPGNWYNAVELF